MLTEFLTAFWPALVFAIVLMFGVWRLALRINNFGIVDIAWSAAFAPIAIFYAAVTHGDAVRRWLIAGMAALWSLRLGIHIFFRVAGHYPKEDVRYTRMREKWERHLERDSFIFFQIQAISVALLSVPFLISCSNPHPGLSPFEYTGAVVWAIAVVGESLSDWQLRQFRSRSENKGKICQAGLWNYSRHPNYFFEWLVWVGFLVFSLGSPWGWVAAYCPLLMLFLLLFVTGIPLTEEFSIKSKGEAYREYQRTTSAFVPWVKRSAKRNRPA
jgi:steroid 5-alpha reductase family enzyme